MGFAANSLLTRAALGSDRLDASTFAIVRLVTGAAMLALLTRVRPARQTAAPLPRWASALALAGYAIAFTLAYRRIGASVGALVLFGSVQVTMIGIGLARGERPGGLDWVGLLTAVAGLLVFTVPGVTAPDRFGTIAMAVAGACWGWYSVTGRGSIDPLAETATNFLRATALTVVALAPTLAAIHLTTDGLLLAAASGALASGVGYTLWYTALPALTALRAAVIQLTVPVLTAAAAAWLLGEAVTGRILLAGALVGVGVGLTLWPRRTAPRLAGSRAPIAD